MFPEKITKIAHFKKVNHYRKREGEILKKSKGISGDEGEGRRSEGAGYFQR